MMKIRHLFETKENEAGMKTQNVVWQQNKLKKGKIALKLKIQKCINRSTNFAQRLQVQGLHTTLKNKII